MGALTPLQVFLYSWLILGVNQDLLPNISVAQSAVLGVSS